MDLFKSFIRINKIISVGLVLLAGTSVQAGEMGPLNFNSWNGVYAGAQLGGSWTDNQWQYQNPNYFNTLGPTLLGNDFSFNARSIIGGGYIGYHYQIGKWVPGVEGSLSATNMSATRSSPLFFTDEYNSTIHALGALKARLGYACDQWMFNINGGYATSQVSLNLNDPILGIQANSSKHWSNGWIVGAGIERKITEQITAGLTYDYSEINLSKKSILCPLCGTGVGMGSPIVNGNLRIQAVMARLSYLFNQ